MDKQEKQPTHTGKVKLGALLKLIGKTTPKKILKAKVSTPVSKKIKGKDSS